MADSSIKIIDVPEDLTHLMEYVCSRQTDRVHNQEGYWQTVAPVVQVQIKQMMLPVVLDILVALEHPEEAKPKP